MGTSSAIGTEIRRDPFLRGLLSSRYFGSKTARQTYIDLTYRAGTVSRKTDNDLHDTDSEWILIHPGRGHLFDYQRELVTGICDVVLSSSAENIGLVSLPTGGGKTRIAIWAFLELLRRKPVRNAFWLAPTTELLDQAVDTLRDLWSVNPTIDKLRIHKAYVSSCLPCLDDPSIYFLTPQMLYRRTRNKSASFPSADILFFDEAHQASAETFAEAILELRRRNKNETALIGLSATPGRALDEETPRLVKLFNQKLITSAILGKRPVESLRSRGVLAELNFHEIPLAREWPGYRVGLQNFKKVVVRALLTNIERFAATLEIVTAIVKVGRALVFAGSVAHANALCAVLQDRGIASAAITNQTAKDHRRKAIEAFEKGDLKVLLNKSILATGYDCPMVDNVVLSVPIGSAILFEQIVGRVSRGPAVGGTPVGNVWQIDDNLGLHGLPSSYFRFRDFDWM